MHSRPLTPYSRRPLAGPAMKASLFFAMGILVSIRWAPSPLLCAAALGLLLPTFAILAGRPRTGDLLAAATLVIAGMFAHSAGSALNRPAIIPEPLRQGEIRVEGTVAGDVRFRYGGAFFTLRCNSIARGDTILTVGGILPCAVYGKTLPLPEGTRLALRGTIRKILRPPSATGRFPSSYGDTSPVRLAISSVPDGLVVLKSGGSFFGTIRDRIAALANRHEYGGRRDLLLAMTIGDVRALPVEARQTFTRSGIAHLLAVSGLNVGVIAVAAAFLLGLAPISRTLRMALTAAIILGYAGVCGFEPPVARAAIMSFLIMGAIVLERRRDVENALFAALLAVLAIDPETLSGASLQLSFAAVWVLIIFYSPVMKRLPEWARKRWITRYPAGLAVATGLSAAVTAPIAATHFGLFPLVSLPVNLPAVPLANAVTISGLASLGLTALGPAAGLPASALAEITGVLIGLLSTIADLTARLPLASMEAAGFHPFYALGFAVWLFFLSRAAGRPRFRVMVRYFPLALFALWTWEPIATSPRPETLPTTVFFDVGQGDAALVRCGGRFYLIDTGPGYEDYSAADAVVLPALRNMGVRGLDGVFVSHFDADHAGGLASVMRGIPVRRLFCRVTALDSLRAVFGERVTALGAGDSLAIPGGGVFVFSPDPEADRSPEENARSLIFRFDAGNTRILFAGDLDPEGQREMNRWKTRLGADILKVPHHGASGLDSTFLTLVHPGIAVVSCGLNNRYGHPASATIDLLRSRECAIRRTDREGTVPILPEHP